MSIDNQIDAESAVKIVAASVEGEYKTDALRYQRLRIVGVAPYGTPQLEAGRVLRFTNLDEFVDGLGIKPSTALASRDNDVTSLTLQRDQALRTVTDQQERIGLLGTQLLEARQQLANKDETLGAYIKREQEIVLQLLTLTAERDQALRECARLRSLYEVVPQELYERDTADLAAQLAAVTVERGTLGLQVQDLTNKLKTKDEQIEDHTAIGAALLETLASSYPSYSWLQCPTEVVCDLLNDIQELDQQLTAVTAERDRIRQLFATEMDDSRGLRAVCGSLQREVETLTAHLAAVTAERDAAVTGENTLRKHSHDLTAKLAPFIDALAEVRGESKEVEAIRAACWTSEHACWSAVEILLQRIDSLQITVAAKHNALEVGKVERQGLREQLEQQRLANESLREGMANLATKLVDTESRLGLQYKQVDFMERCNSATSRSLQLKSHLLSDAESRARELSETLRSIIHDWDRIDSGGYVHGKHIGSARLLLLGNSALASPLPEGREEHPDKCRLDWLQERGVCHIAMDDYEDGTIDVAGNNVRDAIDKRRAALAQPQAEQQEPKP